MEYPYLETEFRENLDKQIIEIINKYWKMDNGVFLNSPTELRIKLGITQPKLNSLIKNNSETKLYLDNCVDCEKQIVIPVTSQSTMKNKIENTCYQCSDCISLLKKELKDIEFASQKLHRLKYAIKVQYWNKLTRGELAVLKKVIEYNDYKTLQKDFIQTNFEYLWPIIEKLDRFSLIDIQREPIKDKIETIYFLPELIKELELNPRNNVFTESSLNFHLPKRINRTKETQPNFSKRLVFDKDIVIEKGAEYICSVWVNSDGSINFGMKPTSELTAQKDETNHFEPKPIGEIIEKLWQ
ncbi:MAG: hypothetical protein WDZ45_02380 [Flavobacteriaceae bacterium]